MTEDKSLQKSTGKENQPVNENGKKKSKEDKPPTKIVVRRLPPSMTEDQFKMQVAPLPDFDYFYFVSADKSLSPNAFCRAYINFLDQNDLFTFTQKFDGYVFLDSKGGEFPAVVEFAPFQRIPKNRPHRKKDPKIGTIEADPIFVAFKEQLEAENLEKKASGNVSKQHFFETSLIQEKKESVCTPLLDFVKFKRAERQRIRDEKREEKRKKDLERRRAKEEQKRTKKDEETSVVKVLSNHNPPKETPKEKEVKPSFTKKKYDEAKSTPKEKHSSESRLKESKSKSGKSYLEERQRQVERREEQRKKMARTQNSVTENKQTSSMEDKDSAKDSKETVDINNSPEEEKETDSKKIEKGLKKEDSKKSSYKSEKYEKRTRDTDESKQKRKSNNLKSSQSNKREEETGDEVGKKRYSESKKLRESGMRDNYKDKEKNKVPDKKKSSRSKAESSTGKPHNSSSTESDHILNENTDKNTVVKELDTNDMLKSKEVSKDSSSEHEIKSESTRDKIILVRRKSLGYEKGRMDENEHLIESQGKNTEIKRRNSVGSNSSIKFNIFERQPKFKTTQQESSGSGETPTSFKPQKHFCEEDYKQEIVKEDISVLKRRNSMGERPNPEKSSPRRNSLGSEIKRNTCRFIEKQSSNSASYDDEAKPEDTEKKDKNRQDPRTERRIRNKDRPSIEIYRPGMGKFSKQRMKGPGNGTEVESNSSSPSPTPVKKHKNLPN